MSEIRIEVSLQYKGKLPSGVLQDVKDTLELALDSQPNAVQVLLLKGPA